MDLEHVHDYWICRERREIFLHGIEGNMSGVDGEEPGVEYQMATRTIKNLRMLEWDSKSKPVVIHMQTCGGFWEDGMAIYDTIRAMPYPVTVVNYSHARSMSSIILQAADHRLMMRHSSFMFHYGTYNQEGPMYTVMSGIKFCERQNKQMLDIYEDALSSSNRECWAGKSIRKELVRMMEKQGDVFLSAEDAVELGFADEVIDGYSR